METISTDEIERIIRGSNIIWNQIFFDHTIVEKKWSFQRQTRMTLDIFNCGSLVSDQYGLDCLSQYSKTNHLPSCFWHDPICTMDHQQLEKFNYIKVSEESEIWRALDVRNIEASPRKYLKQKHLSSDVSLEHFQLPVQASSDDIKESIELATKANQIPELDQFILQQMLIHPAPESQIYLLLLRYRERISSVAMLGVHQDLAFFFLAATSEKYRGLGFSPALRIYGASLSQTLHCQKMITNTDIRNQASLKGSQKTGSEDLFMRHFWKQKKGNITCHRNL